MLIFLRRHSKLMCGFETCYDNFEGSFSNGSQINLSKRRGREGYSGFLNITYWYVSLRKGTLGQCNESNFTFKIAGGKQLRQTIPQKFNIYEKKPLYLGELYGCKNKDKERLTKAKQKTKNGETVKKWPFTCQLSSPSLSPNFAFLFISHTFCPIYYKNITKVD